MAKIQNDRNRALALIVVVLRIMKGRHQHFENLFGDSRRLFRVLLSIAVVLRKEDAKVWRSPALCSMLCFLLHKSASKDFLADV